MAHVSSGCRYAVSLNTLYELSVGLAGSTDEYFEQHQNRFTYLFQPGAVFLPIVGDYLRLKVFGFPIRMRHFSADKIEHWVRVMLAADSRQDVMYGEVTLSRPGCRGREYGVDFELLKSQMAEGKAAHASRLDKLRRGELIRATPEQWADSVLRVIDVEATDGRKTKVVEHLDAAFQYEVSLWNLAKNNLYDFSRHDSDWIDSQQLFYLCDPSLVLVTEDGNLKARVVGSSQENRVLLFREFLRDGLKDVP